MCYGEPLNPASDWSLVTLTLEAIFVVLGNKIAYNFRSDFDIISHGKYHISRTKLGMLYFDLEC